MKKVLITGADGFIGNNLTMHLLQQGVEVYAVVYPGNDIYAGSTSPLLHVVSMDLNEAAGRAADFPHDIDVMYHFAWLGVRPELRNDLQVQMKNITMSLQCISLAASLGIRKVIFPGSTNEYLYYGRPLNKDATPSPNNAYGAAKVALRYLAAEMAKQNGMEFVYAIIASIYAADRQDNNVIFYTIRKLLQGEKPSLTKLEQLWDYVYIDDVLRALELIGRRGKGGAVYAIGHGDNQPLYRYIESIHRKIDASLPLGIGDVPYESDVLPCSCIDLGDLERDTGFVPQVDFETGITKVIEKLRQTMKKDKKDL